jgi:hypothetical protein
MCSTFKDNERSTNEPLIFIMYTIQMLSNGENYLFLSCRWHSFLYFHCLFSFAFVTVFVQRSSLYITVHPSRMQVEMDPSINCDPLTARSLCRRVSLSLSIPYRTLLFSCLYQLPSGLVRKRHTYIHTYTRKHAHTCTAYRINCDDEIFSLTIMTNSDSVIMLPFISSSISTLHVYDPCTST